MTGMEEIESALNQRLTLLQDLPSVAWPNKAFKPVAGKPYFKPVIVPGEPTQAGIGETAMNEQNGIYQVSVFVPAGTGTQNIRSYCKALESHFKRGTALTYNGVRVTIRKAFRGPYLQEPHWISCPVTVAFFAFTSNQ